ncbi:basic secretory protein-like protein [Undibacterium sp. JH2W]|uniref:basic secretory protein-like protein n=1 Tax=Undibacterium sp. JH2W TaxID=3413037 RepID=UPI003BF3F9AD
MRPPVLSILLSSFLLINLPALAAETGNLPVSMHLTRIAADKWRADYTFAEPVTSLEFEKADDFRATAWQPLTAGVRWQDGEQTERYLSDKPITEFSVQVSAYDKFAPKHYAPNNRFSDGGAALYMGFFDGAVHQGGQGSKSRDMALTVSYSGRAGETVIPTPSYADPQKSLQSYAYFGPQKPVAAGAAKLIMDPATPVWITEVLLATTSKASTYFADTYQRPLQRELILMVAVVEFESSGFSMKGGATNGQITYRLSGNGLLKDSPKARDMVKRVVTHEMAHIWQNNVSRGGIGESAPWIHEGGAEAMAMDALQNTALWTAEDVSAYQTAAIARCDKVRDQPAAYDYFYACGLQNFMQLKLAPSVVWRGLMAETEKTGQTYSEAMVDSVSQRLRK